MRRRFVSLIAAVAIIFSFDSVAYAEAGTSDELQYLENHYDIEVENLNISMGEADNEVEIELEDGLSRREIREANIEKATLEFLINRYDEGFTDLIEETVESADENDLVFATISLTECPIEIDNQGNAIRIEKDGGTDDSSLIKEASALSEKGDASEEADGNFALVTSVSRNKNKDSHGRYTYTCKSTATWNWNSIKGGFKYPAKGYDYIIQSAPKALFRTNDSVSLEYNKGLEAEEGTHYVRCDGGENYIKYKIVDDPAGINQMKSGVLTTTCKAKKGIERRINSYYVHTWKSMSVDVSISKSSDRNVTLSVVPSNKEKTGKCIHM